MRNLGNGFAIRIISEEQAQESLRKLGLVRRLMVHHQTKE